MSMGTISLFFALLVSLAYVDARNAFVFQGEGKSTEDGFISTFKESKSPEFICVSCLEVSRKIEKVLTNPALPEKVNQYGNDACHILPSDLRNDCVEMFEGYVHQAVMFLQVFFDEENLCNSTRLCPVAASILPKSILGSGEQLVYDLTSKVGGDSRLLTMLQRPLYELQRHAIKVSGSRSCDACRKTMDDLREDLEDPDLKFKLIKIFMKACENVENHVKQCKRMVLEYGPLVLSQLDKYLKNNDLCSKIHICEASTRDPAEFLSAS